MEFFAPFFHHLYPIDKFKPKPKFLTQVESLLVALVMNHEYAAKMKMLSEDESLKANTRSHAFNVYTLIAYFAPQVDVLSITI